MGAKSNEHNGIVIAEINTGTGTTGTEGTGTTGGNSKSKSSADSGTGGRGRGTNRGSGGTTGTTGTEEKKVVPGVSVLSDEEQKKREERNAKRRERYARQKAEQGKVVKPKKVNPTKKQETEQGLQLNAEQINALIKSLSIMVASRPKCEHWLLSDAEINSITTPLCNMLKDSNIFNKIGEHSNQIALVMACITVFMPRVIKSLAVAKEEKARERRVTKPRELRVDKNKDNKPVGTNNGGPSANGENHGNNELWFGNALY